MKGDNVNFDISSFICSSDPKFLYYIGKLAYKGKIMCDEGIQALTDYITISIYLN